MLSVHARGESPFTVTPHVMNALFRWLEALEVLFGALVVESP
jgi:hypothetical protein